MPALALTLWIALLIGAAWILSRSIAKAEVFKDAPDRDPYLDRLLGEIEGRSEIAGGGGELEAPRPSGTRTNDVRTRHVSGPSA